MEHLEREILEFKYLPKKNSERGLIRGFISKPYGKNKDLPLIIISHGLSASLSEEKIYADKLADYGIATIIYNFRGCGESDGDFLETSVITERDELDELVDFAKEKLEFIDVNNISLMGRSQGGFISGLVANKREKDIKNLFMLSPGFALIDDNLLRKEAFEANPDLEHIEFRGTLLSRKYVFDSFEKEVSLEEGFTNYKGNVQIYHGDADEAVHLSYSQKMSVRYENADLHILPGQGHKYEYEVTLKVLQDIANNINN